MTRITFIMPTYNRADYIAESIASIQSQMTPQDELIVVNDGSTDATETVVRAISGKFTYLCQANSGKSVALNLAMQYAKGEYIWICDDDDLLRPTVVEALVAAIHGNNDLDMVFGRYTRFHVKNGVPIDMGTGYWPDLSSGSLARHILEDSFIMHNASLVRATAYKRMGPFDTRMLRSQDYEMFVRLALHCAIGFVSMVVFDQRKHFGARGPAAVLHSAEKSESIWQDYDALIFKQMHDDVPVSYFYAMFDSDADLLCARAGTLQRATILGRHGLWMEAIACLVEASDIAIDTPITPIEINIIRRSVAGKHGFSNLLSPDCVDAMHQLYKQGAFGKSIVRELARGMLWRLRGHDPVARKAAISFYRELGPARLLFLMAKGRLHRDNRAVHRLTERRVIPLLPLTKQMAVARDH